MKAAQTKMVPMNTYAVLLLCSMACFEVWAQTTSTDNTPAAPLNLRDKGIIRELIKEDPAPADPATKVSGTVDPLDAKFVKAEKHGIIPTTTEISVPGSPQRTTKVTGADGSYCVNTPTVARTDGIDEIQNGQQTQVRTCPQ